MLPVFSVFNFWWGGLTRRTTPECSWWFMNWTIIIRAARAKKVSKLVYFNRKPIMDRHPHQRHAKAFGNYGRFRRGWNHAVMSARWVLRDDVIVLAAIEAHSEMRNRFTRYSTWPSEQNSLSRHRQKSRGQVHAVNNHCLLLCGLAFAQYFLKYFY